MRRRRPPLRRRRGQTVPGLFAAFVVGGVIGWWIHATVSGRPAPASRPSVSAPSASIIAPSATGSPPVQPSGDAARPTATTGSVDSGRDPVAELKRHALRLPLDDADVTDLEGSFAEPRRGEPRGHEAVDLLAPRNTPIRAVEDGKIARLFSSKAGGTTVYQFDPSEQYCYYYAHLDHYASGLREGQVVAKGDVIGYVGTTGNAPVNTPHLHFAILKLGADKRWWKGTAIDPYLVYKQ